MFLPVVHLFAQQKELITEKNMERLKIDFEVKNLVQPDSAKINRIDFNQYEKLRSLNDRTEVFDKTSGYTIVLYSKKECDENRKNLPAKNFFQMPRSDKKEVQ